MTVTVKSHGKSQNLGARTGGSRVDFEILFAIDSPMFELFQLLPWRTMLKTQWMW